MAIMAFIMLKVSNETSPDILKTIQEMDETLEAFLIFGAWDIIIQAEFNDNESLSRFVVDKLKNIPGVFDTQTNVCAHS